MTESPNLSMRKSTGERMSVVGRRVSELQASPFRYPLPHAAGKKARPEATTPDCNPSSRREKSSDSKSTSTTISSTPWAQSRNGSPTSALPMGWSTSASTPTSRSPTYTARTSRYPSHYLDLRRRDGEEVPVCEIPAVGRLPIIQENQEISLFSDNIRP